MTGFNPDLSNYYTWCPDHADGYPVHVWDEAMQAKAHHVDMFAQCDGHTEIREQLDEHGNYKRMEAGDGTQLPDD
jgi:hypothetical protein